jgi:hypothetical protein
MPESNGKGNFYTPAGTKKFSDLVKVQQPTRETGAETSAAYTTKIKDAPFILPINSTDQRKPNLLIYASLAIAAYFLFFKK